MKTRYILVLATLVSPLIAVKPDNNKKDQQLHYLRNYKGPRTLLLSYPRSGNTWLRYICEWLTHSPTFMRTSPLSYKIDQPLAWACDFELDWNKPPIEKVHQRRELNNSITNYNNTHETNKLIVIIRNPKEALVRTAHKLITYQMLVDDGKPAYIKGSDYFDIISIYDSWDPNKRLLVYYETLLTKPHEEIARILTFLNEPLTALDDFMRDYQKHKKICLSLYRAGESKGEDLLFHSKKTSPSHRLLVDEWIAKLYPQEWNKYLKQYYAEEVLDYSNSRIVKIDWELDQEIG